MGDSDDDGEEEEEEDDDDNEEEVDSETRSRQNTTFLAQSATHRRELDAKHTPHGVANLGCS